MIDDIDDLELNHAVEEPPSSTVVKEGENGVQKEETMTQTLPNDLGEIKSTATAKPRIGRQVSYADLPEEQTTFPTDNEEASPEENRDTLRRKSSKLSKIVRERIGTRSMSMRRLDIFRDHIQRTNRVQLCNCKRPYTRAFHFAWLSFFVSFMGWFALGPAVPDLILAGVATQAEVNVSSTMNLIGTIFVRFLLGPLCEAYGARKVQCVVVIIGGILVCLTAAVENGAGLSALRFFVGGVGGAFVPSQFWIAMMYSGEVVGTVAGTVAGFGNSGAGVVVFLVGGLVDAMQENGVSADVRWRVSQIIPGILMIMLALPMYLFSDDCPQGYWKNRKYGTKEDRISLMLWSRRRNGRLTEFLRIEHNAEYSKNPLVKLYYRLRLEYLTSPRSQAFFDKNAWVVGLQYAVASGVELSILTNLTAYFYFSFVDPTCETNCLPLTIGQAAQVASIFGLTNLYGRTIGGWISDRLAKKFQLRGRHLAVFITLLMQGVCMVIWSRITTLAASAGFLVVSFALFLRCWGGITMKLRKVTSSCTHFAKGAVIALTPFVNPSQVGPVMGVVSAVGNLGGVVFSIMYNYYATTREVYQSQAWICVGGSFLAFFLPLVDMATFEQIFLWKDPMDLFRIGWDWMVWFWSLVKEKTSSKTVGLASSGKNTFSQNPKLVSSSDHDEREAELAIV